MVFEIIIFMALIFFGRTIFIGIKTGVLLSAYGEAMTIRRADGVIGYYAVLLLYIVIWAWMFYLLIK